MKCVIAVLSVIIHSLTWSCMMVYPASLRFRLLNSELCNESSIGYVFAHGLGANQSQAIGLFSPQTPESLLYGPTGIFDFADAHRKENKYNSRFVNLGQERDMQHLALACKKTQKALGNSRGIVLYGVSRGSATILNYAARNQDIPIKAIVAEAPFDTLETIIKHLLKRFKLSWIPFSQKIALKIAKKHFKDIDIEGTFPNKSVGSINKEIPILLVHSYDDKVIPFSSSKKLYTLLKSAGHQHTYLLKIPSGKHGKLTVSEHKEMYHNVVHAFYKKYNLPHHLPSAIRGELLLEQCQ